MNINIVYVWINVILMLMETKAGSRRLRLKNSSLDETFYQILLLRNKHKLVPEIEQTRSTRHYHYAGSKICPERGNTKDHYYRRHRKRARMNKEPPLPVTMRSSSCPSHLRLNADPNRIPQYFLEAACNCDSCVGNNIGKCEPMYYLRWVFRINPNNGTRRQFLQKIAVGCTCVYADVSQMPRG